MQSMVYVTDDGHSVCLSHRLTTATAAGGFAAERRRMKQISIDSCGRHAVLYRRRRLAGNADAPRESRQKRLDLCRRRRQRKQKMVMLAGVLMRTTVTTATTTLILTPSRTRTRNRSRTSRRKLTSYVRSVKRSFCFRLLTTAAFRPRRSAAPRRRNASIG